MIAPLVKHVWIIAMHVLHNFFQFDKNTSTLPLGLIQSSSSSTKELHGSSDRHSKRSWIYQTRIECSCQTSALWRLPKPRSN